MVLFGAARSTNYWSLRWEAGSRSMAGAVRGRSASVVHVLSQFPALGTALEKVLPSDVSVKVVSLSEKRFNWNLKLNKEEIDQVRDCQVLLADNSLLAQVLYDVPHLKWAQGTWTGVDHLISKLNPQKPKPSFMMSRLSTDDYSAQMAEYVMAQIVNRERMFYSFWDMQKSKTWDTSIYDFQDYRIIGELTVGIMGGGVFASAIAKLLKASSAKIISFVRTPRTGSEKPLEFDQMETDLSVVLKESDYICNTLPSTPSTKGLLDGEVLKQCLKKPVFINLGRGDIIKDAHLIHALKEKWIAGAVLDVFETEPLPQDNPLWTTPEVIITPHIGANTHVKHVTKCFSHNFNLYRLGLPPQYLIDWNRGY